MTTKPKVALYWCSSCGGCEETVVDLDEAVLDVVAAIDIVFWPCAMDFKYADVEKLRDNELAVSFINGAIRTSEQEHVAKLLRRKSAAVIAFGSCACMGGIPALANLTGKNEIFRTSYLHSPTVVNKEGTVPVETSVNAGFTLTLPRFFETVRTVSQVIDVDYFLPGCPPTPTLLAAAVNALLQGKLPPKGSVLLPEKVLCSSCDRNATKPDTMCVDEIKRINRVAADPAKCLLAQGILCMGPVTRDGCGFPCVKGNMACTGCFGPVDNADQGARMISALGGIIDAEDDGFKKAVADVIDPAGSFYRYSLSTSLLGAKREDGAL